MTDTKIGVKKFWAIFLMRHPGFVDKHYYTIVHYTPASLFCLVHQYSYTFQITIPQQCGSPNLQHQVCALPNVNRFSICF